MARFLDNKRREWLVPIDVYLVEQVAARVGVTIDGLLADDFKGLMELFGSGSAVKFVRVLWVLVEDQAKAAGVGPEDFGRALGGDSLGDAATAFMDALADFCPSRQRTILRALMAKGAELAEVQAERAVTAIAGLKPIEPPSSDSATNSPASSGSTPAAAG